MQVGGVGDWLDAGGRPSIILYPPLTIALSQVISAIVSPLVIAPCLLPVLLLLALPPTTTTTTTPTTTTTCLPRVRRRRSALLLRTRPSHLTAGAMQVLEWGPARISATLAPLVDRVAVAGRALGFIVPRWCRCPRSDSR